MTTTALQPFNVLIVEDDVADAARVIAQVEKLGWSHNVVKTVQAARAAFSNTAYDLVVLDRMLDDAEEGLALLNWFKALESATPGVLVASRLGSPTDHVEALDLGADDYINKPYDGEVLHARLRALARRLSNTRVPESVEVWEDLEIRFMNRSALWQGEQIKLRPQSFDVLAVLVASKGEYVSRETLWHQVWASYKNLPPQDTVLNTAISRLRRAFTSVENAPNVEADRLGYRLSLSLPSEQ
ncbi:MAG: response regulator transcription factor [Pseudomonadales bacterium]|jgi:DNA-binding response OmpR family regulator|nr:response regulator transcription factor [Pseudomonadales bacterium]